jgi:O-antigen/teichoic acid export membrane protein
LKEDKSNILAIWFSKVISIAVPVISIPILMSALGLEVFGLWQLSAQLAAALLFLDLGVTNASVRIFAKIENSEGELASIKASIIVFVTISMFLFMMAAPVAYFLDANLQIYPVSMDTSFYLFFACFVFAGMCIPFRIFTAYLYSRHRYVFVHIAEAFFNLTKLAILYYLKSSGGLTLTTTFVTVFGCQFLAMFVHCCYVLTKEKNLFFQSFFAKPKRSDLVLLLKQSMASVKVTLGGVLLNSGFLFYLGITKDFAMIALVSLAFYLILNLTPFFQSFVTVMSPRAAKIKNVEQQRAIVNSMDQAIVLSMIPFYFLACNVWYFGYVVFEIWLPLDDYSANFASDLGMLLAVMLAGYSLTLLSNLIRALILGAGDFNKPGNLDIVSASFGLVVAIICYSYGLGAMSAAVGYCLALVSRLIFYLRLLFQLTGRSASVVLKSITESFLFGMLMLLVGLLPYPGYELNYEILGLTIRDIQAGLAILAIFCVAMFKNKNLYISFFVHKNE